MVFKEVRVVQKGQIPGQDGTTWASNTVTQSRRERHDFIMIPKQEKLYNKVLS